MSLEGSIKDFGLADIFQLINLQKKSGILTIQDGEATATITFKDGEIVYALSTKNGEKEKVGALFIKAGKLTEKELDDALQIQEQSGANGDKIGHILVDSGCISKEDLKEALQIQIKDVVFYVLRWIDGWYKFNSRAIEYEQEYQIPVPTDFILMEGIRMLDEWPYIQKQIPSDNIIFTQSDKGEETEILLSSIGPVELNIFNLIDGHRDVKSIVQMATLTEFEVVKNIAALKVSGLICETAESQEVIENPTPLSPLPIEEVRYEDVVQKEILEKGRLWTAVQVAILTFIVSFIFLLFPIGEIGGIKDFMLTRNTLKKIKSEEELQYLHRAIVSYQMVNGTLPTSIEVLKLENFISDVLVTDPWGNQFVYEQRPYGYTLYSKGQDGFADSGDDIR